MKRKRLSYSTPRAEELAHFTNHQMHESASFNNDQLRKLARFYGINLDTRFLQKDLSPGRGQGSYSKEHFHTAGDMISMSRAVVHDGQRIMALLADLQLLEPGVDPVKSIIQLAIDAGCDVDPQDKAYAEQYDEDVEESEDCIETA